MNQQDDWTKIHSTMDPIENGIIVSVLQEHDIESVVMNKQDRAYVMIGDIELYVSEKDAARAADIISDLKAQQK